MDDHDRRYSNENDGRAESLGMREDGLRILTSEKIFGSEQELIILHQQTRYRLRITRSGKLILTK